MALLQQRLASIGAGGVLLLVVFAAWMQWQWGGARLTLDVDVLGVVAMTLVAAAACAAAARRHHGRRRVAWLLIGASALCWAAGGAVWALGRLQGWDVPEPGFPDAGYLGAIPLAFAGLALLGPQRLTAEVLFRTLLDGGIIAGALFFIAWVLVLRSVFGAPSPATPLAHVVPLLHASTDLLLAWTAVTMLFRSMAGERLALGFLAVGLATRAVADGTFAYLNETNAYSAAGNLSDSLYLACCLLIAIAAVVAIRRPSSGLTSAQRPVMFDFHPYLSLAIVASLAAWQDAIGRLSRPEIGQVISLGVLVLGRQFFTVIDNQRLTRQLRARTDELRADVAARERAEQQLAYQATHDALTDLPNRTLFADRLAQAIRLAIRARTSVAVLMMDLDRFKDVNDRFGHDVGDDLLRQSTQRLREALRASDTIGRLGGDEFGVVLPETTTEGAERVARKLLATVDRPFQLGRESLIASLTIGIAVFPHQGKTPEALLRAADLAMYEGKRGGGHQAVTSHADDPVAA